MKPSEEAKRIEDHFCAFRAWEAQQRENDRQVEKAYQHATTYGSCTKRFYYSVAEHVGKCVLDVETAPLRVHDELIYETKPFDWDRKAYPWHTTRIADQLDAAERHQKLLLLCSKRL